MGHSLWLETTVLTSSSFATQIQCLVPIRAIRFDQINSLCNFLEIQSSFALSCKAGSITIKTDIRSKRLFAVSGQNKMETCVVSCRYKMDSYVSLISETLYSFRHVSQR